MAWRVQKICPHKETHRGVTGARSAYTSTWEAGVSVWGL